MVYIPTHGFLAAFLADSSEYDTTAVGHFLLKWIYTRCDFSNSHVTEIVVWSRENPCDMPDIYANAPRAMVFRLTFDLLDLIWLIHYSTFFGSEGHVALDRNPGTGYITLLLRMIPGDLLSAWPHRQFHTLPSLLDSRAALLNSYPNALRVMQGGSLYHFYDNLWYDPAGTRTHDPQCERFDLYVLPTSYTRSSDDEAKVFLRLSIFLRQASFTPKKLFYLIIWEIVATSVGNKTCISHSSVVIHERSVWA